MASLPPLPTPSSSPCPGEVGVISLPGLTNPIPIPLARLLLWIREVGEAKEACGKAVEAYDTYLLASQLARVSEGVMVEMIRQRQAELDRQESWPPSFCPSTSGYLPRTPPSLPIPHASLRPLSI